MFTVAIFISRHEQIVELDLLLQIPKVHLSQNKHECIYNHN